MAVYGGFAGGEISLGQRDWTTNVTTLSGDIDGDGLVNSGNSYHVVKGANNATIDGFTITKGNASVTGNTNGGGIYISGTSPTVQNCTIKDNKSTTNGGGIYVANDCFVTIGASCQINSNSAAYGGGIYFSQGVNPSGMP